MTANVWLRTRLLILAAHFARVLPGLATLSNPRGRREGRVLTSHPRSAARKAHAKEPHSSIQVEPNHSAFPARWLDGLCRALPGAELSFWPPSPRELTMPSARLGSRASSQRLDRSNDGQDHTVLPYAAHPASPGGFAGLGRRSSARGYGLTGTTRPARTSRARRRRVHRRPGSQVVTTYDRPSRKSRDGRYIRQIRISVKWNILTRRG
jgi:hypothetical protein